MKKLYQYLETIPQSKSRIFWLVLFSTIAVPLLVNLLFTSAKLKPFLSNQLYLFGVGIVVYAAWLGILYSLMKNDTLRWKHLGLSKSAVRKGLLCGLIVYILVNALLVVKVLATGEHLVVARDFTSIANLLPAIGLFAFNVFVGAFIEEVINRAYLIPQIYKLLLHRLKYKIAALSVAVLLTQLLFAVLHLPADIFRFGASFNTIVARQEELFLSGVIYALVYLRTRNIIFLALYHAFLNYKLPVLQTDAALTVLYNSIVLLVLIFWNKILKTNEPIAAAKPALT